MKKELDEILKLKYESFRNLIRGSGIKWDSKMIKELSEISGINAESLKINILLMCIMLKDLKNENKNTTKTNR